MTDDCVFCARRDQPATLFETPSLYVMPDKFPLRPGHVLIIPKEHHRCYAATSISVLRELDGSPPGNRGHATASLARAWAR